MSKYLRKPETGVANASQDAATGGDDEWETDPDFVNDVSEEEQRWGSKEIVPDRDTGNKPPMADLRAAVASEHDTGAKREYESKGKFSYGYGGEHGVEERAITDAKEREEKEKTTSE